MSLTSFTLRQFYSLAKHPIRPYDTAGEKFPSFGSWLTVYFPFGLWSTFSSSAINILGLTESFLVMEIKYAGKLSHLGRTQVGKRELNFYNMWSSPLLNILFFHISRKMPDMLLMVSYIVMNTCKWNTHLLICIRCQLSANFGPDSFKCYNLHWFMYITLLLGM